MIAVMLILVALAFSALRLLLPIVPGYKTELERIAGGYLDAPVTIERMETDWKWFRPRLRLLGVQIQKPGASASFLQVDEIILGMNPLASAIRRRVEIDEITVVGTHLSVLRDSEGRITVNDVLLYSGDRSLALRTAELPPALLNRTIRLMDSSIDYKDAILDFDYHLDTVNLSGHSSGETNNVYLSVNLPPSLGESLELAFEFSGKIQEIETLKGRAYIRGVAINLPAWARKIDNGKFNKETVLAGLLNVDAWLNFGRGWENGWRMNGRLGLDAPRLSLAALSGGDARAGEWELQALATDFQAIKNGALVRLDLQNLRLTNADEVSWPESGLSLEGRLAQGANLRQGRLAMDFLRLRELLPVLGLSAAINRQAARLGVESLEGDFQDLYLDWDLLSANPSWDLRTKFTGLEIQGRDRMPSIAGLQGRLNISETTAIVALDAAGVELDYPKLFRQPLVVTGLKGEVRAGKTAGRITISGRDLKLDTPHIQSRLWFDLLLGGGEPPFINSYAVYKNGDISATSRYVPAGIMSDGSVEWLDNAFIAGHLIEGDLELRGPLKAFPYRNGEGLFRVDLDGRDTVIDYYKDWPVASGVRGHFRMEGPSLSAALHDAQIFDSHLSNVDVHIADVKDALLELDAQHYGPATDALRYVKETPLREKFDTVIDQLTVSGMQASNTRLRIPIKKNKDSKTEYDFSTATYRTSFDFRDWGLRLGEVNSRFDYSDTAAGSAPFETLLNGYPVTVRVDSDDLGDVSRVSIGVKGQADPNRLLQKPFPRGLQYVSGVTGFEAEVRLALRNDSGRDLPPELHIASDLQGIQVDLPQPFTKSAAQAERFTLDAHFQKNREITADLDYGDWLQGKFVLSSNRQGLSINRANLQANVVMPPDLPLDMPGITIQGRIPALNIDDWRKLEWQGGSGGGAELVNKLLQADLQVRRFTYLNRSVENADISLSQELHNWRFDLRSALAQGSVLIPKDGFERRGLAIDVKYLDFDRINAGSDGGEPPDPSTVPPFQLSADKIILNAWQLKNVKMLAAPIEGGIKAHTIRIEDPSIGMQGEGEWVLDDSALHQTKLRVRFDSEDVGQGLENFGYAKVIRDGSGSAEFDVNWAAAPAGFSLGLLKGSANIALKDGQILDIEPGGGRLLGLLSVQTIPRRLALDFKDVFAKGFRFDKMKGHFNFADGNAYTTDYYIDGPPGRINIEGRTGLLARDYDQRVSFRPDLSSSLPLVGTLLGGTSAGVAMIVVDRIARIFGKQTDDLARFEYTLSGSWEEPVFTPVVRREGKAALSDRS